MDCSSPYLHVCHYCRLPPAFWKVVPALHEAAPPGPQREPPPPPRRSHAVRPLPQRCRPLPGASAAVLEVRVHKRQSGFGQGNADHMNAILCFKLLLLTAERLVKWEGLPAHTHMPLELWINRWQGQCFP